MDAVFSFAERYPDRWRLLFGNTRTAIQRSTRPHARCTRRRVVAVGALLASDAEAAGIDPESRRAEVMVEMLIAALRGAAEWRREHPEAKRAELVEAGSALLWTGLGRLGS